MIQVVDYTYDVYNRLLGRSLVLYNSSGDVEVTREQAFVYDNDGNIALAFVMGSGTDRAGYGGGYVTDGAAGSTPPPSATEWSLSDRYLWVPGTKQSLADEDVRGDGGSGDVLWALTDNEYTVRDILLSEPSMYASGADHLAELVDHISYTPFGAPVSENAWTAYLFEYDGELYDQDTGLQLEGRRWYSPAMERWLSADPAFPLTGTNPYEYVNDSPTNYVDPTGLDPQI